MLVDGGPLECQPTPVYAIQLWTSGKEHDQQSVRKYVMAKGHTDIDVLTRQAVKELLTAITTDGTFPHKFF
jgi:hypothetical protein